MWLLKVCGTIPIIANCKCWMAIGRLWFDCESTRKTCKSIFALINLLTIFILQFDYVLILSNRKDETITLIFIILPRWWRLPRDVCVATKYTTIFTFDNCKCWAFLITMTMECTRNHAISRCLVKFQELFGSWQKTSYFWFNLLIIKNWWIRNRKHICHLFLD